MIDIQELPVTLLKNASEDEFQHIIIDNDTFQLPLDCNQEPGKHY